jgi:hypothetical protein
MGNGAKNKYFEDIAPLARVVSQRKDHVRPILPSR